MEMQSHADVLSVHANDPIKSFQLQPARRPAAVPTARPTATLTGAATAAAQAQFAVARQAAAPWNLNRLGHPELPVGGDYNYSSDGTGVNVYVVDTVPPPPPHPTPGRRHRSGLRSRRLFCQGQLHNCPVHIAKVLAPRFVTSEEDRERA